MTSASKIREELASRRLYVEESGREEELRVVKGFLERMQFERAEVAQRERPDFDVRLGGEGCRIGLELTTLNADARPRGGSKERQTFAIWKRFSKALTQRLISEPAPLPQTYGSITFVGASAQVLSAVDEKRLCDDLVRVLKASALTATGSRLGDFDSSEYPTLAGAVTSMFVRVFPSVHGPRWWSAELQSGFVVDPIESIRRSVEGKVRRAADYDWGEAAERWLLIYAAGHGLTDLAVGIEDPGIAESAPFTTVFLWDQFSETISTLAPTFTPVLEAGRTFYRRRVPIGVQPYLRAG